jgi:hypothetical protein
MLSPQLATFTKRAEIEKAPGPLKKAEYTHMLAFSAHLARAAISHSADLRVPPNI